MIAKCNKYEMDRNAIRGKLKGGMKVLRTRRAQQDERKVAAKANAEAAANRVTSR